MKRFLPDSFVVWALIIVIAGLTVTQIATFAATMNNRAAASRMVGFFHLAERVSSITRAVADQPAAQRENLAEALSAPTLTVRVEPKPLAGVTIAADDELAVLVVILQDRLTDSGIADVHVERHPPVDGGSGAAIGEPGDDAGPVEHGFTDIARRYAGNETYVASIQLGDGSWINFTIPVAPTASAWSLDTVALALLVVLLVVTASIWALRRLIMPYGLLADAAERFGRDLNAPPLPEKGPREIRAASHAFNLMQERLQRVVSDRDQLAAAISHDIRTPVTRLRLRAEFIEDPGQRARMLADLDEIEVMTQSILTFARDAAQPEPRETIDLISLLETLCDDMPGASLAAADLPPRLPCAAEPVALKRGIANLIDNAVRYGGCARVSLAVDGEAARIAVDDDGPGIAAADMESVFRPFRRLETSRNRETGGTGLGLTIARSVARAHGGDVALSMRPGGGMRAEFVLPLAAAKAVSPASAGSGPARSLRPPARTPPAATRSATLH
jgi:signal transduction histidine kinase